MASTPAKNWDVIRLLVACDATRTCTVKGLLLRAVVRTCRQASNQSEAENVWRRRGLDKVPQSPPAVASRAGLKRGVARVHVVDGCNRHSAKRRSHRAADSPLRLRAPLPRQPAGDTFVGEHRKEQQHMARHVGTTAAIILIAACAQFIRATGSICIRQ